MAKLSKRKKISPLARDDVAMVRRRFEEAKRAGHSQEEAARLAQSGAAITRVVPERVVAPATDEEQTARTRTVSVSGSKGAVVLDPGETETRQPGDVPISLDNIPPNWRQDLPWPQLKALADSLAGRDVKSRKVANEVIEAALKSSQSAD